MFFECLLEVGYWRCHRLGDERSNGDDVQRCLLARGAFVDHHLLVPVSFLVFCIVLYYYPVRMRTGVK